MSEEKTKKWTPILCLDFDGVLHSYESGWQGAEVIPDDPVPGAMEFLIQAVNAFEVHVFSSRSGQKDGIFAMKRWLMRHLVKHGGLEREEEAIDTFHKITFPKEKPPAMISIDDRCLLFTGEWPAIQTLLGFQPWNKKGV